MERKEALFHSRGHQPGSLQNGWAMFIAWWHVIVLALVGASKWGIQRYVHSGALVGYYNSRSILNCCSRHSLNSFILAFFSLADFVLPKKPGFLVHN